MAVADPSDRPTQPLGAYAVSLALNFAWTPLFFGSHRVGAALADISALWVTVAASAALFSRVNATAGALLLPYLGWVTFAAALNLRIWQLNGDGKGE